MNKFKDFLKERWIKSGKSMYGTDIKIFINPTRKELREMGTDVRGFVAPNGNAYIGSTGIHPDIANLIEDEINPLASVPFIIEDSSNKTTKIEFGDYFMLTKYKSNKEIAKRMLEDNRWMKTLFPKADITGEIY